MRLSTHDDYGIRLLLRISRGEPGACMTTTLLAEREGMTMSHAGKVLRLLRLNGFVEASRGNCGGYTLTRPSHEISVAEVLVALGGRLCETSAGSASPIQSFWCRVQREVDGVLEGVSLFDLEGEKAGGTSRS